LSADMDVSDQETAAFSNARAYAQAGFRIFPVYEPRDGNCACGNANCSSPAKHPRTRNGYKDATTDLAQIERWWRTWPDANIGIATGQGLVVIDSDGPKGEMGLQALQAEHASLPETAAAKTSRGLHLYFRFPKDEHVPCSARDGLDVRGDGGFVVAPFSRHISGHVYEWVGGTTPAAAPVWLLHWTKNRTGTVHPTDDKINGLGELPAYLKNIASPAISEQLDASLKTAWSPAEQSRLEAALSGIEVKSCGYDDFLKIGFALHSLNWDRADGTSIGFDLWNRWCSQSDHYNQAGLESKWQSFERSARSGVTIGTVFHMAKERGWIGPSPEPVHGNPSASIFNAASFFPAPVEPSAALKAVSADVLLSVSAPKRSWLVDRFIPAAEVTMIGGDGGTGKTTLALQLGLSCVSGETWLGLPVNRCGVIYVSAEDPTPEVHYRLEQITKHRLVPPDQLKQLKLIDVAGKDAALAFFDKGLLKPTQLLAQIETIAREHQAGCIIFDAVADFFGGNENERREARAFVGLLRGLAMDLNAAVVFLAHPSVDGIKTGRGYSGSTHWNNAVRSRLYFTTGPQTKDEAFLQQNQHLVPSCRRSPALTGLGGGGARERQRLSEAPIA
jgi:archaellum biogenesis ATPase FlaH